MNLKPVQIDMDIGDVQRVLAISMDEDKDAASRKPVVLPGQAENLR